MILNIRTKEDYEIYIESLEHYILSFESSNYYGFPENKFKDALNNPVVFVSNATDGAEYGIVAGQFYSYKTILFVNNKLKKQSKELPIWHTSLDDLRYFKSQVSSKDFRFINDIDNLPESVIYRKKAEKEIPTHSEILAHIENNPVGTDGYTNSGTPTDKTYEDAKDWLVEEWKIQRELEGEKATVTLDPVIIEDPEITGRQVN